MVSDEPRNRRVARSLNRALNRIRNAGEPPVLDVESARFVIFSDHHRGVGDGADDFRQCVQAYHAALAYYFELGYTLVLLGDVEELWECSPKPVMKRNTATLLLEKRFADAGRYLRIFGNHDGKWRRGRAVRKYLGGFIRPTDTVREGALYRLQIGNEPLGSLLLVHGHHGTIFSYYLPLLASLVVRYFVRPLQRLTKKAHTQKVATHWKIYRDNSALFAWAKSLEKTVLIAGHTHLPVFLHGRKENNVKEELEEERRKAPPDQDAARIATLSAELAWLRAWEHVRFEDVPKEGKPRVPCYFNTGCCSYGDGDVTAIEISDACVRLVRWPDDVNRPLPKILASAGVRDVYAQL